jgi:hypothetical protein
MNATSTMVTVMKRPYSKKEATRRDITVLLMKSKGMGLVPDQGEQKIKGI